MEFAYNNTVHIATGNALFQIVKGEKKVLPMLNRKDKIFEVNKFVESYQKVKLVL